MSLSRFTGANVNIVAYKQGAQNVIGSVDDPLPDGIKMKTPMTDSIVGETFDWNSGAVTVFEDTVYAFGATLATSKYHVSGKKILLHKKQCRTLLTAVH